MSRSFNDDRQRPPYSSNARLRRASHELARCDRAVVLAAVAGLSDAMLLHLGMLAGFAVCALAMMRWDERWWVPCLRPAATLGVIFTCDTSLGALGIAAIALRRGRLALLYRDRIGSTFRRTRTFL